jgi:hypothetical protein
MKLTTGFSQGIFLLGTALLLFGCKSKPNSGNQNTSEKFTPHPVIKEHQNVKTLEIGAKAPFFKLPDIHGNYVSIDDFKN